MFYSEVNGVGMLLSKLFQICLDSFVRKIPPYPYTARCARVGATVGLSQHSSCRIMEIFCRWGHRFTVIHVILFIISLFGCGDGVFAFVASSAAGGAALMRQRQHAVASTLMQACSVDRKAVAKVSIPRSIECTDCTALHCAALYRISPCTTVHAHDMIRGLDHAVEYS